MKLVFFIKSKSGKKGFGVGTIRTWKGLKYRKVSTDKWAILAGQEKKLSRNKHGMKENVEEKQVNRLEGTENRVEKNTEEKRKLTEETGYVHGADSKLVKKLGITRKGGKFAVTPVPEKKLGWTINSVTADQIDKLQVHKPTRDKFIKENQAYLQSVINTKHVPNEIKEDVLQEANRKFLQVIQGEPEVKYDKPEPVFNKQKGAWEKRAKGETKIEPLEKFNTKKFPAKGFQQYLRTALENHIERVVKKFNEKALSTDNLEDVVGTKGSEGDGSTDVTRLELLSEKDIMNKLSAEQYPHEYVDMVAKVAQIIEKKFPEGKKKKDGKVDKNAVSGKAIARMFKLFALKMDQREVANEMGWNEAKVSKYRTKYLVPVAKEYVQKFNKSGNESTILLTSVMNTIIGSN